MALSVMSENFWHEDRNRYERFQPQGRRDVRTCEQDRRRNHRTPGEGGRGIHQILEPGSGAGCPSALDQGSTRRGPEAARIGKLYGAAFASAQVKVLGLLLPVVLLLAGCGHKPVTVAVPPAPPAEQKTPAGTPPAESGEATPPEIIEIPPDAKPLLVETGIASWYGAPYHNRRGSNGEIYDMHAMTAAHRTLPLGSIVRVTNVKTGHAAVVRITDRGPFVPGRIVDLSLAAAKKTDVWQPGIARVRVEVLQTPTLLETSGRWAVQIGAFDQENAARTLAGRLSQRYRTAKVLCFNSPVGDWWVRVRVRGDDKKRAEELAHETQTPQGSIFLVRLD